MKWCLVISALLSFSCEKDNFDGAPDAAFYGELRDSETGELLQQDIIQGSQLYYIELGWENPPIQSMVIKNDGTFRNNFMFSGDYKLMLERGNYVKQDTIRLAIEPGDNKQVYHVVPYIRIINPKIEKVGDYVKATFSLVQNTDDLIQRISLFAHPDLAVGSPVQVASVHQDINSDVSSETLFELELNLNEYPALKQGKSYYFRIGALSRAPEAKYNYVQPVDITLESEQPHQ